MAEVDVLAVIPVRWGSTRFPGKPLADLHGRPVVEHVWRRARAARLTSRVVVATDDHRIAQAVSAFGGEVMMTASSHVCGSDRVAEVATAIPCHVVVNIQGDEPLLDPESIDKAVEPLLGPDPPDATTLAAPLAAGADASDPHLVKVVTAGNRDALYFSRAPIPFRRHPADEPAMLHHIGLYAFRRQVLLAFTGWPATPLERAEGLEQLRLLEHGRRLRVVLVPRAQRGIDTPADLEHVRALPVTDFP